ncbi:copia-like retrotransposon [Tanacetum coccineum]
MDTGASSMMNFRMMNQECVKLDKFDGCTYTRWAEKIKFLLIVLKIYYVLDPELPPIPANPVPEPGKPRDEKKVSELKKQRMIRKEDENLCCGHIKNSLSDTLYDLYASVTNLRELWRKTIMEQVHELQVLINKLKALSIPIKEAFQVGAILTKLPTSWKSFSKKMLNKTEDYSLDDLLKFLRIEEEAKTSDK